jgi:hypothetical protein
MVQYFGDCIPVVYKTHEQDHFVYKRLNSGFFDHLGFENTYGTGLTHLYISGNKISVVGTAKLLQTQRLHVLDAGHIIEDFEADSSSMSNPHLGRHLGAETLVPLLELCGPSLSYLRLDHSVVTKTTSSSVSEIPEMVGDAPQLVSELDGNEPAVHELEGDGRTVQELPNDPSCFELEGSPVPSSSPKASPIEKRDLSEKDTFYDLVSVAESPAPVKNRSVSTPDISSPNVVVAPLSSSDRLEPPDVAEVNSRQRTLSGIVASHEARLVFRMSQPHSLLPSMVPNLQTLLLTDVPTHSPSSEASTNIISFISACAEEAYWSSIQSKHAYALPPGRDRISAEKTYAKSLFALRRVILEMKPVSPVRNVAGPISPSFVGKSSVEDPDCEEFWTAGEKDFSFFGPGEEECGVPNVGIEKRIPLEARMGKMVVDERPGNPSPVLSRWSSGPRVNSWEVKSPLKVEMFDVLAAVSKFRKDKKLEYQNAVRSGNVSPYVEGYWEGDIIVVKAGQ